jgi:ABC-type multidrug transport system fused ATPase/permease subunit
LIVRGLACTILALVLAWKFSIVFIALIPIMVFSTMKMIDMIKKYTIEEFKSYGQAGRIAQEILSSLRTVYAFGLERKSINKYEANLEGAEEMAKKKGLYGGIFGSISTGTFNFLFGIGIYYAVYLIRTECQNFSPVNVMPSFFCLITAGFAFGQAFPFLTDLGEARGAARRVFDIIDTKSAIDIFDKPGKILNELVGDVELENVVFSYPQRPDMKILKGLNLKIPGGKTVALVGSRYAYYILIL